MLMNSWIHVNVNDCLILIPFCCLMFVKRFSSADFVNIVTITWKIIIKDSMNNFIFWYNVCRSNLLLLRWNASAGSVLWVGDTFSLNQWFQFVIVIYCLLSDHNVCIWYNVLITFFFIYNVFNVRGLNTRKSRSC